VEGLTEIDLRGLWEDFCIVEMAAPVFGFSSLYWAVQTEKRIFMVEGEGAFCVSRGFCRGW